VDFAICDFRTLQVIGIIELDDSSHKSAARKRRDEFKDKALAAAGVPIVRIPAQRGYSPAEVREQVSVLFGQK
jgi:very-short-patch-repair endonuclease